jgi:hypothetical protein
VAPNAADAFRKSRRDADILVPFLFDLAMKCGLQCED